MEFRKTDPPRQFTVGFDEHRVTLRDCGTVILQPDEQVTFTTLSGGEYDVTRKSFGFYATPSLNARLPKFGLRAVLVRNRANVYYVLLVEDGKTGEFDDYVSKEKLTVIAWLSDRKHLDAIAELFAAKEKK